MASQETILVIEDDAALRAQLRTVLEGLDLAVLEADTGPAGLEAFQLERPGLVLLDVGLPLMNGVEVCRALKALPGTEDTAVIIMSGSQGAALKLSAFHAGAVDYLDKPFRIEELEVRIRTHLRVRAQAQTLRQALDGAAAMNRNLVALNEKLSLSDTVKSRFLALMRNEINNPLNDIMGLADGIASPGVTLDRARELAAMVKGEAFRMACQIHNVFVAAELEVGEAAPSIARVDQAAVATDVLDSFRAAARDRGLELVLEADPETAGFATDGAMLQHILSNLVANAVQHSDRSGAVQVQVAVQPERLVLTVCDPGPGLAPERLATLFDPFRLGAGPYKTERGQGLGLPVAKALTEILDGELQVASLPGAGSQFRVILPRSAASEEVETWAGNVLFFDDPQAF